MTVVYYSDKTGKNRVCVTVIVNPVLGETSYVVCVKEDGSYNEYTYDGNELGTAMGQYWEMVNEFKMKVR